MFSSSCSLDHYRSMSKVRQAHIHNCAGRFVYCPGNVVVPRRYIMFLCKNLRPLGGMGIDGHNFCVRYKPPIAFEMNLGDKACPQKGNSSFQRGSLKYEYLFWNSFGKRNSLWRTARMPLESRKALEKKSIRRLFQIQFAARARALRLPRRHQEKFLLSDPTKLHVPNAAQEYLSDRYLHCDVGSHNRKSACDRSQDSQKSFPCDS